LAPPRPPKTVAILGTGLIGGSLALALSDRRPEFRLIGFDSDRGAGWQAAERGAIHEVAASAAGAVGQADIVVLAAPLAASLVLLRDIAGHLREGTLVTDVGSVKDPIMSYAREILPPTVGFVGGHPMAGAEHSGMDNADPLLFQNAVWVLCPPEGVDHSEFANRFAPVIDLVTCTGARPFLLDAARHDRIAAAVSHLPQLVAVALVNEAVAEDEAARDLAAGGFRDMTRIASSPYGIWREIFAANQGPVLDVLARFSDRISRIRHRIAAEEWGELEKLFDGARTARAEIPTGAKGFLQPLSELTVRAEDKPGYLLGIVKALTGAGLNIKDVELLKVREGAEGVFRFGFADEEEADRAVEALKECDYEARRL
jgi:prephenate dehydrogenase